METPPFKFSDWDTDLLKLFLKIERTDFLPELDEWIGAKPEIEENKRFIYEQLNRNLREKGANWNEAELLNQFISPFLTLVDFNLPFVSPFSERKITAKIDGYKVGGKIDWMLALGEVMPRRPFFFIHEYKPETEPSGQPLGQLLIEMFATQTLNQLDEPMYGCYIIGANWNFVVLKNRKFAVSKTFVAKDDDLYQIVGILQAEKRRILDWLKTREIHAGL